MMLWILGAIPPGSASASMTFQPGTQLRKRGDQQKQLKPGPKLIPHWSSLGQASLQAFAARLSAEEQPLQVLPAVVALFL